MVRAAVWAEAASVEVARVEEEEVVAAIQAAAVMVAGPRVAVARVAGWTAVMVGAAGLTEGPSNQAREEGAVEVEATAAVKRVAAMWAVVEQVRAQG